MNKTLFILIALLLNISIISSQTGAKVGDAPPGLSVEGWLKGEPVTSFEKGKVYLLEFWGTWCSPCIENIPHLSTIEEKYSAKGMIVIGAATHEFNGIEGLDKFMKKRGDDMKYRVAYDTDYSMQRDWDNGTTGGDNFRLPICFLIDKSTKIVFIGHPSDETLDALIESTVNE